MNRAVEENKAQFPEAERLVKSSFYVDNMLTSFETEDEALNGACQVHAALATRGFNLTQWMASSRKLLTELKPFGLAAPTLNIDFDELPTERTLGICGIVTQIPTSSKCYSKSIEVQCRAKVTFSA